MQEIKAKQHPLDWFGCPVPVYAPFWADPAVVEVLVEEEGPVAAGRGSS